MRTLVVVCIIVSAAAGGGGWYAAQLFGLAPSVAAALGVSLAGNMAALGALLLLWRDQGTRRQHQQRIERMERHAATTARAIKSVPSRVNTMISPVEERLARIEREAKALRDDAAACLPADNLGSKIAAITAAMQDRPAPGTRTELDAAPKPSATNPPEAAEPPSESSTVATPRPSADDLPQAVENLVARYTRRGMPRPLPSPKNVNDDPTPTDRMEAARDALTASAGHAEKLAAALLRQTLENAGITVTLAPVCRLPNRRPIWQEAISQLSGGPNGALLPGDYLPLAGAAGLMPEHDTHVIAAVERALRDVAGNTRVFLNLHPTSLSTTGPVDALKKMIERDPNVPQRLIIEFAQADIRDMGKDELRGLDTLARLGFDLSMDAVHDLRLDWRAMARQGFRFVKVPAHVLCGDHVGSDVHPADLGALLDRHGLSLIAEDVDGEGILVQLEDHDVRFAQGRLLAGTSATMRHAAAA